MVIVFIFHNFVLCNFKKFHREIVDWLNDNL